MVDKRFEHELVQEQIGRMIIVRHEFVGAEMIEPPRLKEVYEVCQPRPAA